MIELLESYPFIKIDENQSFLHGINLKSKWIF